MRGDSERTVTGDTNITLRLITIIRAVGCSGTRFHFSVAAYESSISIKPKTCNKQEQSNRNSHNKD